MKTIKQYIDECGATPAATPATTTGMGNPAPPTETQPGSEPLPTAKIKRKKKKVEESLLDDSFGDSLVFEIYKYLLEHSGAIKKKEKSVFGIDENLSYCVKILNSDGSKNEFLFGNSDFSGLNRFVFFKEFNDSQLNNKILKTDFNIDELFHTETRFWIDPYLIPKSFTLSPFEIARIEVSCNSKTYNIFPGDKKNLDGTETEIISKLLDLRHGQVLNAKNKNESVISLKVELSGGDVFSVLIKPYSKTDYSVEYITDSKNDKYNYSVLISNWTFKTVWSLLT